MNKVGTLSSIARRVLSPNLRTLHNAGYIADDLSITKKGKNRLLAVLLEQNMDEVVAEAKAEIADEQEVE